MVTRTEIIDLLKKNGLKKGDTIMVHSALKKLGEIYGISNNDRTEYCKTIYECIDNVIDIKNNNGTLAVPTFTHDYVRKQKPFYLETSLSETGVFTEYIRNLPDSIRTLHPIDSNCIIGVKKKLFRNLSSSAYGINSFFDVLSKIRNSKILYFGASTNHTTLMHHIEHLVGVSYLYNKAYFYPDVYQANVKVNKPFFCAVRYLNGKVNHHYEKLETRLVELKLINIDFLNEFKIMSAKVSDIIRTAYEMLQEDQCVFLDNEFYMVD